MEFLTWWFDKHYIVSTLITTEMAIAWCVYKGLVVRGLVCVFLILLTGVSKSGS